MSNHTLTTAAPPISDELRHRARRQLSQERLFRREQLASLQVDVDADPSLRTDEVWSALRGGAQRALTEAERALDRLDGPGFGRCERCAGPIHVERLRVLPMAPLCMACQYERESGRR